MLFSIVEAIACSERLCSISKGGISNNSGCQSSKLSKKPKHDGSNKTYRIRIDKENILIVDFSKPKEELVKDMINDFKASDDYFIREFDIEHFECKAECYEYQDMRLDASDEVLADIAVILNNANNTQRFKVEYFEYQEDLTIHMEVIKNNLKYSKNPEKIIELFKELDELWDKSNKHICYALELIELCKKPEIEEYIEYFNAFYNEIFTFAKRLSKCGIDVMKNFGEELDASKGKDKNTKALIRYLKLMRETYEDNEQNEDIKRFHELRNIVDRPFFEVEL